MSDNTEQNRKEPSEPERYKFYNSYISSCTLYFLDGTRYTFLHRYLSDKLYEIRSSKEEQKLLTNSEMCDWVKRLIEIYESTEDDE